MITLPFILILIALGYFQGKFIRDKNTILYIIFTVLSVVMFIVKDKFPLSEPFVQGYLGFSFLYVVMIAGAFKNTNKLRKKLIGVRREYSILGFIILTPHALKYILEFLFDGRHFEWFGVAPYIIMIPLFITSFMVIRKKMNPKTWKTLQQYAYIVYILIFVHLIIVSSMPNLALYIVLFTPYIILKIVKEFTIYQKKSIMK